MRIAGAALAISLGTLVVADGADAADADPVVVTVAGTEVRASAVSQRLAEMPAFQLRTLGKTPAEIRKRFVDTVLVPELLAARAARDRKLPESPTMRARLQDARRRLLRESIQAEVEKDNPISEESVQRYYDDNKKHFETPKRIKIWRILVGDRALAKELIVEAKGKDGAKRWAEMAREHSLDPATKMRGGSLGFVYADGRTDVPRVRVDPALYTAADRVEDGDVVAEPVAEGERFAVVWRRGSVAAVERPLEEARGSIRQALLRRQVMAKTTALLEQLRKKHVRDLDPNTLHSLPKQAVGPTTAPPPRGSAARRRADPVPKPTDRGLR